MKKLAVIGALVHFLTPTHLGGIPTDTLHTARARRGAQWKREQGPNKPGRRQKGRK